MPIENEITPEELKKLEREKLEQHFATQLKQAGVHFKTQIKFAPERKWRYDFGLRKWEDSECCSVLIDLQGGTWSGGAHVRGKGYENDVEKMNEATSRGWEVYWFTGDMVTDGRAIIFVLDVILI